MPVIAIIGTFDTKEAELLYVREVIESRSTFETLVIDTGTVRPYPEAALTAKDIAANAGTSLEALQAENDRGKSVTSMAVGIGKLVRDLHAQGKLDGVISLGGSAGTTIGTAAMRALPIGVPKLMVSTMASGDISPYMGTKDIAMMYSVVDVSGLNRISKKVLRNAAGAICGMVEAAQSFPPPESKGVIAATMFGVTTPCVTWARQALEAAGYEVLVFHATGSGGRAMEDLIREGEIDGVLDITTTEWCDELVGGVLSAGPTRLEAAAEKGIPQVVSLGALDMVNFGPRDTVPNQFQHRNLYVHNPTVTLMRTTREEMAQLGAIIAQKVSASTGPAAVFLPLLGVSAIDVEGGPFYDSDADLACFEAVSKNLSPKIELHEEPCHINDPFFAEAMANRLIGMLKEKEAE